MMEESLEAEVGRVPSESSSPADQRGHAAVGRRRAGWTWLGLALLGLAGVGVVLVATPWGAGLGGDSYYYVSGARSLLAGLGFARPAADGGFRVITHYPPGYSLALAALTATGIDTLVAARWLAATLFGLNVALAGALVFRVTRSAWPAWSAGLLVLGSPALIVTHTWVLSESLFLFLALLLLIALGRAAERGTAWRVVSAGFVAGMAYLTRYVGVALIGAGGLALLAFGAGALRRRLSTAFGFGVAAVLGPALWAARNLAQSGSISYRAQSLHPPSLERLFEAAETSSLWLLPSRFPSPLREGAALLLVILVVVLAARVLARGPSVAAPTGLKQQVGVVLSLAVVYPLSLVAAITLVGSSVPLDDRILSPLLVALLVLGVLVVWDLQQRAGRGGALRIGLAVAAVGFLALTLVRGAGSIRRLQADGQGAAARAWQESALIDWVRRLPAETAIYSNELDIIYLYTGRQVYQAPIRWDPVLEAPRHDYSEQLATMREAILHRGAVLVLFDTIGGQQAFLPSREELSEGLSEWLRADDGAVYGAAQ